MMYDELIKNLRGMAKGFCPFDIGNKMCGYFVTQEAADAIVELQAVVNRLTAQTNMVFEKTEGRTVIKFEPKWIPVTERLPRGADKSGKVCENVILLLSVPFSENYVTSGWINGITGKVYYVDEFDDFFHKTDMSAVKAWMPLPQPPKAEEGE